jgi:hypothetical protein
MCSPHYRKIAPIHSSSLIRAHGKTHARKETLPLFLLSVLFFPGLEGKRLLFIIQVRAQETWSLLPNNSQIEKSAFRLFPKKGL